MRRKRKVVMNHTCHYCGKISDSRKNTVHLSKIVCLTCKTRLTKSRKAIHHIDGNFENNDSNNIITINYINYRDIEENVLTKIKENPLITWLNQ